MPRLAILLSLAPLFLFAASSPRAELSLVKETVEFGEVYRATIRFTPEPAPATPEQRLLPLANVPEDLRPLIDNPAPAPGIDRQGALLSLPRGTSFSPEGLSITMRGGAPVNDIQVDFVRIGPYPALSITAPSKGNEGEFDLSLSLRKSASRTGKAKSPERIADSLFINKTFESYVKKDRQQTTSTFPPEPPGTYRIGYSEGNEILRLPLDGLGLSHSELDQLELLHHGQQLPVGGTDGSSLWFYGPRRNTLTDATDSVFATPDNGSPSPAMSERAAYETLSASLAGEISQARSRFYEENRYYERSTPLPIGERFVYHQVRFPAGGGYDSEATADLPFWDAATSSEIRVTASFVSITDVPGTTPDHEARLGINGESLPLFQWEGRTLYTSGPVTLQLSQPPGPPALSLSHEIPRLLPGVFADRQNLESLLVEWEGYPRLNAQGSCTLELPEASTPRLVTIGGFPPGATAEEIILLDITDPYAPVKLLGFERLASNTAIEFEAPAKSRIFHAQYLPAASSPATVAPSEELPHLPGGKLERIYVRPPEMAGELSRLVEHRGAESTWQFEPQAAYNVYNGGQESPEAIQQALKEAIAEAEHRVSFPTVLLVGHGSLDRRDYLGIQSGAQIPPFVEESVPASAGGVTIESPTDFPYALLEGEDDFPDARVGRLPVRTPSDLAIIIDRILDYDEKVSLFRDQERPGLFITDNDGLFLADSAKWPGYWDQTGQPSIRYDIPLPPLSTDEVQALRDEIRAYLEQSPVGMGFVLYIGHGNTDIWASERLVDVPAIPGIATEARWPIVATFTCLNGYYAFPGGSQTLAEAWLLEPNHGAVANMAPTSIEYYFEQSLFTTEVMEAIALPPDERPRDAGGVLFRAWNTYTARHPLVADSARIFNLFGDPETSFAFSQQTVSPGTIWQIY